jgi:hypothetical protein
MPGTRLFDLLAPSARGAAGRQRPDCVPVHHAPAVAERGRGIRPTEDIGVVGLRSKTWLRAVEAG